MLGASPASVRLSAWLNAARRREVSATDAANACEAITGQLDGVDWHGIAAEGHWARPALPEPGDPWGVPITGAAEAVALGDERLLVLTDSWREVHGPHAVPVVDQAWARRNLTDTMSGAREALSALATVGDRTAVEAALASPDGPWPPALPARTRGDLELARGVLVTATLAPAHVSVPSSRSQDNEAAALLRDLAHAARLLLCAAVSA